MSIMISNERFEAFLAKAVKRTENHEEEDAEFIALNESWWSLLALYDTFSECPERQAVKKAMDVIEKRMAEMC